jgi:hypothetical protein
MKKIFFVIVISSCGMLNVQGQTNSRIAGSAEDKRQDLLIDTTKKNKYELSYNKVVVQFIVGKKSDSSYVKVEVKSGFQDEVERWKKVFLGNLNANTPKKNKANPGTYEVIVQFISSKDGSTFDIAPLTSLGYGMESEVVRVLRANRKGPKWFPAPQYDNIVIPLSK